MLLPKQKTLQILFFFKKTKAHHIIFALWWICTPEGLVVSPTLRYSTVGYPTLHSAALHTATLGHCNKLP